MASPSASVMAGLSASVMARLDPAIAHPHQFANDAIPVSNYPMEPRSQYVRSKGSSHRNRAPQWIDRVHLNAKMIALRIPRVAKATAALT
jgi:hypothetical protein